MASKPPRSGSSRLSTSLKAALSFVEGPDATFGHDWTLGGVEQDAARVRRPLLHRRMIGVQQQPAVRALHRACSDERGRR
jgi:hypothetical protein